MKLLNASEIKNITNRMEVLEQCIADAKREGCDCYLEEHELAELSHELSYHYRLDAFLAKGFKVVLGGKAA